MSRVTRSMPAAAALAATTLAGSAAHAEVSSVAGNGFEVRETVHVAAAPDVAYAALLIPARWWGPQHTFSGHSANLHLEAKAGGCWCEQLDGGGSVLHLTVVYVSPGKAIRLRGALGPLQSMGVDGALTMSVKGTAAGTDIEFNYAVGGYSKEGFDELSKVVDGVLTEQVARLKRLIDTGSADTSKS